MCQICGQRVLKGEFERIHREQHDRAGAGIVAPAHDCPVCGAHFPSRRALDSHNDEVHANPIGEYAQTRAAANNNVSVYRKPIPEGGVQSRRVDKLFVGERANVYKLLETELALKRQIRYWIVPVGLFVRIDAAGNPMETATLYLRARGRRTDVAEHASKALFRRTYTQVYRDACARLEALQVDKGSGWSLQRFTEMVVEVVRVAPLTGGGLPAGSRFFFLDDEASVEEDGWAEEEEEEEECELDREFIDDAHVDHQDGEQQSARDAERRRQHLDRDLDYFERVRARYRRRRRRQSEILRIITSSDSNSSRSRSTRRRRIAPAVSSSPTEGEDEGVANTTPPLEGGGGEEEEEEGQRRRRRQRRKTRRRRIAERAISSSNDSDSSSSSGDGEAEAARKTKIRASGSQSEVDKVRRRGRRRGQIASLSSSPAPLSDGSISNRLPEGEVGDVGQEEEEDCFESDDADEARQMRDRMDGGGGNAIPAGRTDPTFRTPSFTDRKLIRIPRHVDCRADEELDEMRPYLTDHQLSVHLAPYNTDALLDLGRYRFGNRSMAGLCLYDAIALWALHKQMDLAGENWRHGNVVAARKAEAANWTQRFVLENFPDDMLFRNADLKDVDRLEEWMRRSPDSPECLRDAAINVLGVEKLADDELGRPRCRPYPLRVSPHMREGDAQEAINILYISYYSVQEEEEEEEEEEGDVGIRKRYGHYVLLTSVGQFLRRRRTGGRTCHRLTPERHVCLRCMQAFCNRRWLGLHSRYCSEFDTVITTTPRPGEVLTFTEHVKKSPLPVFGVADFECVLLPNHDPTGQEGGFGAGPRTVLEKRHKPVSFTQAFVGIGAGEGEHNIIYEYTFASDDQTELMNAYFASLRSAEIKIKEFTSKYQHSRKVLTRAEWTSHCAATRCWICEGVFSDDPFRDPLGGKVVDHCHVHNTYLGPAHRVCNAKRRRQTKTPVFFHNFSSYDAHLLAHGMQRNAKLSALAYNSQKFRTVTWGSFTHMDSMAFVQSGLGEMASVMKKSGESFPLLGQSDLARGDEGLLELLHAKGVFPYSAYTSLAAMQSAVEFPSREQFYDDLDEKPLPEAEYIRGREIWDAFQFESVYELLIQ